LRVASIEAVLRRTDVAFPTAEQPAGISRVSPTGFMSMKTALLLPACLLSFAACGDSTSGPAGPLDLSGDPPIRTSADEYVLETTSIEWRTEIPITYFNPSHESYFLANCGGSYFYRLEKWVEDDWVFAWGPFLPLCLSPVIRIEPGESFADTLWVSSGFPDVNYYPKFRFENPAGRYRVVIEALSEYDEDRYPFGPLIPLERRVSNAFQLVIE
jgi:hypothetical protein